MTATFRFFDPTAAASTETVRRTRTLDGMAGRRVALFDNSKFMGDVVLERVGELLRERYGVAAIVSAKKSNYSAPADDELL
ncbi:MAG TPA: hypothetical protein VHL09_09980, partial [Dehalococcoidia bacterium]|nr:hypothetical protein [Dehalococcoidia bacterium]